MKRRCLHVFLNLMAAAAVLFGTFTGCDSGSSSQNDPVVLPDITISDAVLAEGDSGTVLLEFTVTLSRAVGHDVTVSYTTADGTAQDEGGDGDYTGVDLQTLTIPAGFTEGGIVITVNGDTRAELDETFTLTLSAPVNALILDGVATGTITNDDPLPGLTVSDLYAAEGSDAAVTAFNVNVTLSEIVGFDVSVSYATADGTAGSGDYTAVAAGTITIPAGTVNGLAVVNVDGDNTFEADETFTLTLSAPIHAVIDSGTATVTIANDDDIVLYIDPTADNTDGLTWATAFNTVQAAIDAVDTASGLFDAEIMIAAGVYTNGGGTNPVADLQNNMHLRGGYEGYAAGSGAMEVPEAAGNPAGFPAVLDGADSAYHVVCGAADASLAGITVQNGNAFGSGEDDRGAGLYLADASGMFEVRDCVFTGNAAQAEGGAVYCGTIQLRIANTVFHDNRAAEGAGVAAVDSGVHIAACRFEGSLAAGPGGAISLAMCSAFVVADSLFLSNGAASGGALAIDGGSGMVSGCTVTANIALSVTEGVGGGLRADNAALEISNTIVWNNAGVFGGPEIWLVNTSPYAAYSCIGGCGGSGAGWDLGLGEDCGGNIDADPLLVNVPLRTDFTTAAGTISSVEVPSAAFYQVDDIIELDNDGIERTVTAASGTTVTFTPSMVSLVPAGIRVDNWGADAPSLDVDACLAAGSPCIETGDNNLAALDVCDLDGDADAAEKTPYDLDGNLRPADSDGDSTATIDMGCLEYSVNLFFSEYIEGSSYNKALEIYNAGTSRVDLIRCVIDTYSNGSTVPSWSAALDPVILKPGEVYVVVHTSAGDPLKAYADELNGLLQFNGDDAVVLTCDGVTIDAIGRVGEDPGDAWGTDSVTTKDHTLRRMGGITTGDTDGSNAFNPLDEWEGFPVDSFDELGIR